MFTSISFVFGKQIVLLELVSQRDNPFIDASGHAVYLAIRQRTVPIYGVSLHAEWEDFEYPLVSVEADSVLDLTHVQVYTRVVPVEGAHFFGF